jgi:PAS domain S-box-containing protein
MIEGEFGPRDVLATLTDGVVVQDADGTIRACNPSAERILGLSQEEIKGRTSIDSGLSAVREDGTPLPAHESPALITLKTGEAQLGVVVGLPKPPDGTLTWVSISTQPLVREGNTTPYGVVTSFSDITHTMQRQLAVEAQSRAVEMDAVLAAMNDAVFIVDIKGTIIRANPAAVELLGTDPVAMQRQVVAVGLNIRRPDGFSMPMEETPGSRALRGEQVIDEEILIMDHRGDPHAVLVSCSPLITDGAVVGIVIVGRDITERKRADERFSASLREKEVLIKEVHHRVKNNLQVIASMLNLQAGSETDDRCRVALRDSQNRIRTLALIHEKLYSSGDLAEIPIKDYIEDLTSSLFRSLSSVSGAVSLQLDIADVLLDINAAIPVALILNELISNSLEHAFPKGVEGEISITFKPSSASRYRLTVKDSGVGMPGDMDFRNTESLGLQLVCLLTKQLDGEIELDGTNGTEFTIGFFESKGKPGQ